MTSRNQGLSPNDKGRQRRESLGTRLENLKMYSCKKKIAKSTATTQGVQISFVYHYVEQCIRQFSVFYQRPKLFNSLTPEITYILQNKTLETYNQQILIL